MFDVAVGVLLLLFIISALVQIIQGLPNEEQLVLRQAKRCPPDGGRLWNVLNDVYFNLICCFDKASNLVNLKRLFIKYIIANHCLIIPHDTNCISIDNTFLRFSIKDKMFLISGHCKKIELSHVSASLHIPCSSYWKYSKIYEKNRLYVYLSKYKHTYLDSQYFRNVRTNTYPSNPKTCLSTQRREENACVLVLHDGFAS